MPEKMTAAFTPLMLSQPWCADFRQHDGEPVDYNLDSFRKARIALDRGELRYWHMATWPRPIDTWSPCLAVKTGDLASGKILVARTFRYRNHDLDYSFLLERDDTILVGLPHELRSLDPKEKRPHLTAANFLELARAVASAKLTVANQTFVYWLAESLKTPRILEQYPLVPNVLPIGGNGVIVTTQANFEAAVDSMASR
jgi:hypothetical protein